MLEKRMVALAAALLLGACQQNPPVAASAPASASTPPPALVNALPDDRFVGFSQTVNDFEIQSGQLALAKSSNELVRGYANRAVAEYPNAAQALGRNRAEAGVSYAPDDNVRSIADTSMTRLNSLQGADFDRAYADAQLRVQTAAVEQYGAYSQNGRSGPLRRYAQEQMPRSQAFLEYAKRLAGSR